MVHNLLEAGMAKAEAGPDIATMSFEDALRELEQIVHRLEAAMCRWMTRSASMSAALR